MESNHHRAVKKPRNFSSFYTVAKLKSDLCSGRVLVGLILGDLPFSELLFSAGQEDEKGYD